MIAVLIQLVTAASLLLTQEQASGPVSASLEIRPGEATIAEAVHVRLVLTVPRLPLAAVLENGQEAAFAAVPIGSKMRQLQDFQLLEEASPEESIEANHLQIKWHFTLAPRRTGELRLPSFDLVFAPQVAGQGPITIRTNPVSIHVKSLVKTDPLKTEPRPAATLPTEGAGSGRGWVILSLLAAIGWYLIRLRGQTSPLTKAPEEGPDPSERAIAELARETEPAAWLEILRVYLKAKSGLDLPPAAPNSAAESSHLAGLLRDLEAARFAPETRVQLDVIRERLKHFIQTANR
jgi:hypothetical protein